MKPQQGLYKNDLGLSSIKKAALLPAAFFSYYQNKNLFSSLGFVVLDLGCFAFLLLAGETGNASRQVLHRCLVKHAQQMAQNCLWFHYMPRANAPYQTR